MACCSDSSLLFGIRQRGPDKMPREVSAHVDPSLLPVIVDIFEGALCILARDEEMAGQVREACARNKKKVIEKRSLHEYGMLVVLNENEVAETKDCPDEGRTTFLFASYRKQMVKPCLNGLHHHSTKLTTVEEEARALGVKMKVPGGQRMTSEQFWERMEKLVLDHYRPWVRKYCIASNLDQLSPCARVRHVLRGARSELIGPLHRLDAWDRIWDFHDGLKFDVMSTKDFCRRRRCALEIVSHMVDLTFSIVVEGDKAVEAIHDWCEMVARNICPSLPVELF